MSYRLKIFLVSIFGVFLGMTTAYGQEGHFPGSEEHEERPAPTSEDPMEEGMQIWDNDGSNSSSSEQVKPQVNTPRTSANPGGEKKSQVNNKEGDKSVLSFNFLYYLIQKFKLSESVE